VSSRQHRWKNWVDDRTRKLLEDAAEALKWSWQEDQRFSKKKYPVNTWCNLREIQEALENRPRRRTGTGIKVIRVPTPARKLSDLLDDQVIKAVYEDHNRGSYVDALNDASKEYGAGGKAWRKIRRALDSAHVIMYHGLEYAPEPRNHFLHRNLLAMAESANLRDLTAAGIAEFFDDVCPCGKKHNADAMRKLSIRRTNQNKCS
jgi:hypothetical protein